MRMYVGVRDLRYYFNGGILLFNNREIEREEYLDRALKALSFPLLPTVDQDALYFIFKGEVKIVSQRYNFQYHLLNEFSANDLNNSVASEYFSAGRNPVIVHYTTHAEPWKTPSCALGSLFWEYARLLPFYEKIIFENLTLSKNESYELKIKKLKIEFEQKHKKLTKETNQLNHRIKNLLKKQEELDRIKCSNGYKALKIYYKIRDFFIW